MKPSQGSRRCGTNGEEMKNNTRTSSIDRRTFTQAWVAALLGGATITITEGCGGSSPTGPQTTPTPAPTATPTTEPTATPVGDEVGDVSNNHGHSAVITAAQLEAGGALTVSVSGGGHSHSFQLSGSEVVSIRDGQTVSKQSSSTNSHRHFVTFN
jgi:hypothetical protein